MRFRDYIESDASMGEEKKDILQTLSKIPTSHRNFLRGFSWKFQGGNTLNGDDQHVGYMDDHEKEIAVAAPWSYGREFTILHEVAHTVWEHLPRNVKQQWVELVNRTKHTQNTGSETQDSLNQNAEEIFCHSYANFYTKHKLLTYSNPEWMNFIKNLPA